jgi:hypothetical protein
MRAKAFNQCYSVGCRFVYRSSSEIPGARVIKTVKTVDIARDFKCGTIVEIDREPYFVKVDSLSSGF